ncbi:PRA1 family protein G2-like [Apium graveolens]|uniref:PRA1 family protein G2-like n=1 Tax=Apium graveolens TaxID=4045 RepID=UPI003D7B574B
MQSPRSPTASVYTPLPISFSGVISRSFHNLSTFISRHRPWPEFLSSAGEFTRPDSLTGITSRLRLNSKYFGINYTIIITVCTSIALLGAPLSLLMIALVCLMWILLWFCREDQIVIAGSFVSDQAVVIGLGLVSVVVVWFAGVLNSLLVGISVGILVSALHCLFRNPDGLFLDENDAVHSGLIGSQSSPDGFIV